MDPSHYFYRNVVFSKQGKTISLVDIENPKVKGEVLESWFGAVLQLADGQHTVDQLLEYLSAQYNGSPPSNLKETVHSVVERLAESKFIVLIDKPVKLPYYLSAPVELLDLEKAKELMLKHRAKLN
jgi:hypothetical protein